MSDQAYAGVTSNARPFVSPDRVAPADEALGRLDKVVAMLGDSVDGLGSRLRPVLGPDNMEAAMRGGDRDRDPSMSEIVGRIHDACAMIESANRRLGEYMDRLQV